MRYRSTRSGFTLVELLVVIAIIGILIALLLPAVQAAREAARRSQCANNLKQIGLALHNYNDSYGSLPPAWVWATGGAAPANGDDYSQWGWGALILPFMEQETVHEAVSVGNIHLGDAVMASGLLSIMQQPIASYRCPTDAAPEVQAGFRILWDTSSSGNYFTATSNYVAAHGSWGDRYEPILSANQKDEVGAFQENVGVKFAAIRDGTSNTIAVGERRYEYNATDTGAGIDVRAALIFGLQRPNNRSDRGDQTGQGQPKLNYSLDCGVPNNCGQVRSGFSSHHPGGAMFVFCDGSTHFITETIEYGADTDGDQISNNRNTNTAYERLIARADGQPVGNY